MFPNCDQYSNFQVISSVVSSSSKPKLKEILKQKKEADDRLLKITFTTLSEYLYTLRELTSVLNGFGTNTMLYLAAAVSDFYIPPENMVLKSSVYLFLTLHL